jgi:hypothetical protein
MENTIGVDSSLKYLSSPEALDVLDKSGYWPKWDGPWWHMSLLHELGETKRIPEVAILKLVEVMNSIPQKEFPVDDGADPNEPYPCHCQIGNIYQILWAYGVNVDEELSWMRPYMLKYQMADGGLNCEYEAYCVTDECPSSMVGTIAVFEALLFCVSRLHTAEELSFLDKAAGFLIARKLSLGSDTVHNAEERESAKVWSDLCFPRFYFYDILRGLNALLHWAEFFGKIIPLDSVSSVLDILSAKYLDGRATIERQAFANKMSKRLTVDGKWERTAALTFELLDNSSRVGNLSSVLSKQWEEAQARARRLHLLE